jgi:hypothetical protein
MPERSVVVEIGAAMLLGIAALLTALCAYQADKVSGEASGASTASSQALIDANLFFERGNSSLQFDEQVFLAYVNALNAHDDQAAKLIDDTVMSDELRAGIKDLKNHPDIFEDEDNPYVVQDLQDADDKQDEAERLLARSGRLDDRASQYQISAVLFGVTLFFGGIATLFKASANTLALLALAAVALLGGGIFALTA